MGHGNTGGGLRSLFSGVSDLFSKHVFLNIKGHHDVPTAIGTILTVVLVTVVVSQGLYSTYKMFFHLQPAILQLNDYKSDPPVVHLNKTNNFNFGITLTVNSKIIDMTQESIITFTGTTNLYRRRESDGEREKIKNKITFEPCQPSDFPDSIFGNRTYTRYNLAKAYCPRSIVYEKGKDGKCPKSIPNLDEDCNGPPDLNVRGVYLSKIFEFTQIMVSLCDSNNQTLSPPAQVKCMNLTKIWSLFGSNAEVKVSLIYANNVMDPTNYATPNKTFVDQIYWTINPKISKSADIFVDAEISQDSANYISPFYTNKTFYSIDANKVRETQNSMEGNSTSFTLLTFHLRRSSFNSVTTRTYLKVQDILGQIGGFTKSLLFFLAFFVIGYAKYKYQMVLSNELYDFEPEDKKSKKNKKGPNGGGSNNKNKKHHLKETAIEEDLKANAKLLDNDNLKSSSLENNEIKEFFDYQKEKKRGLYYNEYSYLKTLNCCRRKTHDEKLAEKAMEQIEDDVDLVLILKKLREIDKLKTILLDRDQRELFNYNPKPIISKDDERASKDYSIAHPAVGIHPKRFFESEEEYQSLSQYGKLYVSYRRIRDNEDPAKANNNALLLEMLGTDLLRVFKHVDNIVGDSLNADVFEDAIKRAMDEEPQPHEMLNVAKDCQL